MLSLKQFRSKAKGVADLLPWAALIDEGVILNKDGSLMAGWFFRGPDAASMTPEERNYLTSRVNNSLARMGSGWALWFEAVRMDAASYPAPEESHFPDPITEMIDEERRRSFMREAAHFETEHALVAMYTPPFGRDTRILDFIYDDDGHQKNIPPSQRHMEYFKRGCNDIEDSLSDILKIRRMKGFEYTDPYGREHLQDELVNFLNYAMTGELTGLNIPPCAMYLDALLSSQELWPGDTPKLGERFFTCIAIEGFPAESFPLILDSLMDYPVAYRFSTRWLPLDTHEAVAELNKFRRKWQQKKRGFWTQVLRMQGGRVNEDAALMERQAEVAISDAESAQVNFGYYTPVIVLSGPTREELMEQARNIVREVRRLGFASRVETVNTLEAWLGTLPGNVRPNVRRPLLHSLNVSDLVPLSAKFAGLPRNPSPMFPPESPPLMHTATVGATPFRLNLHVSDVGHTLIFGPTGAGKSVLLGVLAAQFRRYKGAKVTVFDKGHSMYALAAAAGGDHYYLAGDETSPGLCPLAFLDDASDVAWAEDWLASCFELQVGSPPTPRQKDEIHRAISLMRRSPRHEGRTLTDFIATVQDETVRDAIGAYTIDGPLGQLLDARSDGLKDSTFTIFEIEELMGLGERSLIPVLLYIFRRFERSLTGEPALLILDEAWIMLGHATFREKIREWLKVLRKANCAVVLATQSLSDAVRSGLFDVLLESCPTKILLPNEEADKRGTSQVLGPRDIYALFGINDAEIRILQNATKKRHYYYVSPEGRRLFDLGLGPVALAFTAVSSKEQVAEVKELVAKDGAYWPYRWLEKLGVKNVLPKQ